MGCRAVGVVACAISWAASAARADAPPPSPAPPELSWYGAEAPAAVPEQPPRVRHIVQRAGLFMLGGGTYLEGAMSARIDAGVPTPINAAPRLRLVIISEGSYGTQAAGAQPDATLRRTLAVTPALQYEWHLPFEMKRGELLVIAAAGIRRTTVWLKMPDEPFYPSTWESESTYALRLTAGVEYRGKNGLIVSAQPLSASVPLGTPTPPDPRWMDPAPTSNIAVSLVAGYQFR